MCKWLRRRRINKRPGYVTPVAAAERRAATERARMELQRTHERRGPWLV